MELRWAHDTTGIDWGELSVLYRIAPLGDKSPEDLRTVYAASRYICFVSDGDVVVGAGRALADGRDCSYLCDIVVHPDYQSRGIGKGIVRWLVEQSRGHRKIILYAEPGKEGFYARFGFRMMQTAMALFEDEAAAVRKGVVEGG